MAKRPLYAAGAPRGRLATQQTLVRALDGIFRLLHPFMPFVTEELWHALPWPSFLGARPASLMLAAFPRPEGLPADEDGIMQVAAKLAPELSEPLTWAEICARYPDEWVCLVEIDQDDPFALEFRTAG